MINCTPLFAHQVADLAHAVQNHRPQHPMSQVGEETRMRILDVLRTHGPLNVSAIAERIGRTRANAHHQLLKMADETPPRVRLAHAGYNARWEAA